MAARPGGSEVTAEEIVRRLNGKWSGGQALVRCPVKAHGKGRGDLSPSLSVTEGLRGRVLVHCFAGCRSEDIFAALLSVAKPVASDPMEAKTARAFTRRSTTTAAHALWDAACSVWGTSAELYLRSRGLTTQTDTLRLLPRARHPNADGAALTALLAPVCGPYGTLLAVQRTFLTHAGVKAGVDPVRMMLGRLESGAVKLAPAAAVLGLAEGVETALAASQLHDVPCWAACGARLERIAMPAGVRHVILFADNDPPGLATADRAIRRFRAEGRHVEVLAPQTPGTDWADIVAAYADG